jgi:hypothetical protein
MSRELGLAAERLLLPTGAVVAGAFEADAHHRVVPVRAPDGGDGHRPQPWAFQTGPARCRHGVLVPPWACSSSCLRHGTGPSPVRSPARGHQHRGGTPSQRSTRPAEDHSPISPPVAGRRWSSWRAETAGVAALQRQPSGAATRSWGPPVRGPFCSGQAYGPLSAIGPAL